MTTTGENTLTADGDTAFFGGSFDPPHLGHLAVAAAAIAAGMCRWVTWVPAYAPPHKNSHRVSFADRAAMVELTIADHENMSASRIEEELKLSPSYTFCVIDAWYLRYRSLPALLIGADSLLELHNWHRGAELAERCRILTYPRRGYPISEEALAAHWKPAMVKKLLSGMISGNFFEISSSELKSAMEKFTATGDIMSVKNFLAPGVTDYIIRRNLYIGTTPGTAR